MSVTVNLKKDATIRLV